MRRIHIILSGLLLFFGNVGSVAAEEAIGDVVFARGAVSAQGVNGQLRILGKDALLYRGDTIRTAKKSFAVLRLNDGTRLSVRPNTILAINEYVEKQGQESATMRLFRGGLRAISGLLSKRNPEAFKIRTAVATIGIRGTEFDARLCEADCAADAAKLKDRKVTRESRVIGRAAFVKGGVQARDRGGESRQLTRGAPLYEGDEITTGAGAYAILVFRDEGRVTIKPESVFRIEQYRLTPEEPQEERSWFNMLKGGIRSLSGLMSKRNPSSYRVNTAVATIGIRGTGFDLLWLGPCTASPDCGLIASVWEGVITSDNDAGLNELRLDQTARIGAINLAPEFISQAPVFNVPRPDTVNVDINRLFGAGGPGEGAAGLYVACYEGHCKLFREDDEEDEIDLGAGEAGFADEDRLMRLEAIEPFQEHDPYLKTINELFDTLYELLDDNVIEETEFECVVQ